MKIAGLPGANKKSVGLPLNMTPVGDPGAGCLGAFEIVTTRGTILASPIESIAYKVEVPPALLDTHQGLVGVETNPQAFCKLESVTGAPLVLETRFVWT
jgi:hypothetical protein